jgi:hypothetical protein
VAYFSVEADLTWDFAVDVSTLPWMERISLHTGLDGSDSFLASDRGGNRSHRQDRCANQRYPESKTEIQRTAGAQVVMPLESLYDYGSKVPLIFKQNYQSRYGVDAEEAPEISASLSRSRSRRAFWVKLS